MWNNYVSVGNTGITLAVFCLSYIRDCGFWQYRTNNNFSKTLFSYKYNLIRY